MKDTREKILHTALTLFNRQGLPRVTLRAIAKEMGISQGNLNYHYKKRDEIIEALYFQLVARIDMEMEKSAGEESPLEQLF
ncbi:MAG TPA: TetR/AcrR family transcriptional regulator, partial [Caldithrix abyssi]|nr:TetR/AcrR family transcriptional regulator [Caldithrix abyssi]